MAENVFGESLARGHSIDSNRLLCAVSNMFAALRKYDSFSKIQDDVRVKTTYGAAGAPSVLNSLHEYSARLDHLLYYMDALSPHHQEDVSGERIF